nr:hypothetical protein [Tanacetum cinerariifolium]
MSNDKESSAAGTDNRAPMLVEYDYESWKIRMKRYIQSKPQGKAIWKPIVEGPALHPMTVAVTGVANVVVEAPRPKRDEEAVLLAYLAYTSKHQTSTTVASPTSTSSSTLDPEQQAQSGSDAMMGTMQQLVNLLSGFQKQFPPTNNQLRTSSNPRSHATMHEGQIVTETVQRKALGNVSNAGTKGNQGYGKKTDRNGKKVFAITAVAKVMWSGSARNPREQRPPSTIKSK